MRFCYNFHILALEQDFCVTRQLLSESDWTDRWWTRPYHAHRLSIYTQTDNSHLAPYNTNQRVLRTQKNILKTRQFFYKIFLTSHSKNVFYFIIRVSSNLRSASSWIEMPQFVEFDSLVLSLLSSSATCLQAYRPIMQCFTAFLTSLGR